jgi:hypothetical protein
MHRDREREREVKTGKEWNVIPTGNERNPQKNQKTRRHAEAVAILGKNKTAHVRPEKN